jgi:Tfp pilus assembly protein PilO
MHTSYFKKLIFEAPLLVFTGSTMLVVVLLARYLMLPICEEIIDRRRELAHYHSLISSESGYAIIKKEISKKNAILESRLSPKNKEKNTPVDLSGFLETLITVAKKADIRFVRMQPQKESRDRDYVHFPVLLELTTTYHELGQFITELEKLPYLFQVNRLAMSALAGGKCEVKLLVTCLIPGDEPDEQ